MSKPVIAEVAEPFRPMFGSGFVSNGWSGAMLEEGPGMVIMGVVLGAFAGLLFGLITFQVVRFLSFSFGRNFGGLTWTLISMAIGAIAFGVMTITDKD